MELTKRQITLLMQARDRLGEVISDVRDGNVTRLLNLKAEAEEIIDEGRLDDSRKPGFGQA